MPGSFEGGTDAERPGDPVPQHDPCPAETVGDPDPEQRVVAGAPGEGGVDVRSLVVGKGQPSRLRRAADRGGRILRLAGEPVRVRGEGVIGRTRIAQPAGREGPDGIEQAVARGTAGRDGERDERPVSQPADDVDRRGLRDAEDREHALHRGQRCPADEAGQGLQSSLVVGEQQLVAPGNGRGQDAATLRAPARRVPQQAEPVLQPAGYLPHRERSHPGGRQLDRQRQPVEGLAELLDDRRGVVVEHELPADLGGTIGEELDRFGDRQRLDRIYALTVQPERELARSEHGEPRCGVEEQAGQIGGRADHVLAVVQDQKASGSGETLEQHALAWQVHRLRDRLREVRAGIGGIQPYQPDAVRCGGLAGQLYRQPGLADPGRPGQGHQGAPLKLRAEHLEIRGSADER